MPSIADLAAMVPPALEEADLALERGGIRASRALERSLLLRNYRERTVPGIINNAASRGSFWFGNTSRDVRHAGEDLIEQYATGEVGAQSQLADLLRGQFLTALGLPR